MEWMSGLQHACGNVQPDVLVRIRRDQDNVFLYCTKPNFDPNSENYCDYFFYSFSFYANFVSAALIVPYTVKGLMHIKSEAPTSPIGLVFAEEGTISAVVLVT
ncbi:uncharacterized protein TNCV_827401 [Trichonephila clavipes]|nr:uncharacterized protein TNCV_827401 [Trichonephila clavipes]